MNDPVQSAQIPGTAGIIARDSYIMWMSNVLIVVDRNNPDHNSITDLAAAVQEAGAQVVAIDDENHVIEADMPTHEVVVVAAMDGVSYVRNVFSYFKDQPPQEAA
jgi:hypothetical protein